MSNSPQPFSSIRNGGFLKTVALVSPTGAMRWGAGVVVVVVRALTLLVTLEGGMEIICAFFEDGGEDLVALLI